MAENVIKIVSTSVKEAVDKITGTMKGLAQDVGGKFREVMSEELQEIHDLAKQLYGRLVGVLSPIFKPLQQLFKGWFKQFASGAILLKYVKRLLHIEEIRRKEEIAQKGIKGKGFLMALLEMLAIPVGIILMAVAGMLRRILWPLEMAWKFIRLLSIITTKIPLIGPLLLKIKKGIVGLYETFILKLLYFFDRFPILGKIGDKIGKIVGWFKKAEGMPFFGKALKMMKFGFKIFGWPFQLILSAIDFIKGFRETKGNLLDKIKGGLKNAIMKFVEFPLEILGAGIDWVLRLFGIEDAKAGAKMKQWMSKSVDFLFTLFGTPINAIINFVKAMVSEDGTLFQKTLAGIDAAFKTLFDLPVRGFIKLLSFVGFDEESMKEWWKNFSLTDTISSIINAVSDFFLGVQAYVYNFLKNNPVAKILPGVVRESMLSTFGDEVKERAKQMEDADALAEAEEVRKREEEKLEIARKTYELMRQKEERELAETGKIDLGGGLSANMSRTDGRAPASPPPAAMPATKQVNSDPYAYGEALM
jgi:hypothetical protein